MDHVTLGPSFKPQATARLCQTTCHFPVLDLTFTSTSIRPTFTAPCAFARYRLLLTAKLLLKVIRASYRQIVVLTPPQVLQHWRQEKFPDIADSDLVALRHNNTSNSPILLAAGSLICRTQPPFPPSTYNHLPALVPRLLLDVAARGWFWQSDTVTKSLNGQAGRGGRGLRRGSRSNTKENGEHNLSLVYKTRAPSGIPLCNCLTVPSVPHT